jgi:hypothetical protein
MRELTERLRGKRVIRLHRSTSTNAWFSDFRRLQFAKFVGAASWLTYVKQFAHIAYLR